ncbi:MAG: nucleoside 2-deoxyribosyltransferase [Patescibacteria group bacterium]|nr:nucleoside 2-deoxyribosyltransferase [Patescibacteria group bacterium]
MKIYFAGAITGGRYHQPWYKDIIEYLQGYGEVITQQIGDKDLKIREGHLTDDAIFTWLVDQLAKADAVVADVTVPSLGVGYEIALAEKMGKNILCLFNNETDQYLSAMISGNPNLSLFEYKELDEVCRAIDEYFKEIQN